MADVIMRVSAVLLVALALPSAQGWIAHAPRAAPPRRQQLQHHALPPPPLRPLPRSARRGAAAAAASEQRAEPAGFGARRLISYLWPSGRSAWRAKLRIVGALLLLLSAKVFVVRVPFIFKRCVDSLGAVGTAPLAPVGWMLAYGLSRAVYTWLQEARYVLFTPVGQSALRRFVRDAFEHVQLLDAGWLSSQSTGELSRVFARGVRGMNALLRLVVFNIVPTAIEAALVIQLLGRRYGPSFLLASLLCVSSFVAWSLLVVERRVALLVALNDNDNRIFSRFFNSLLNNEAVRSFTNEAHEVRERCVGVGTGTGVGVGMGTGVGTGTGVGMGVGTDVGMGMWARAWARAWACAPGHARRGVGLLSRARACAAARAGGRVRRAAERDRGPLGARRPDDLAAQRGAGAHLLGGAGHRDGPLRHARRRGRPLGRRRRRDPRHAAAAAGAAQRPRLHLPGHPAVAHRDAADARAAAGQYTPTRPALPNTPYPGPS